MLTRNLGRHLAGGGRERLDRIRLFDRHETHRMIAMHCASSYKQNGQHWQQQNFGQARVARRQEFDPE